MMSLLCTRVEMILFSFAQCALNKYLVRFSKRYPKVLVSTKYILSAH